MFRKSQQPTVFAPRTSKKTKIFMVIGVVVVILGGVLATKYWLDHHINHDNGYSYIGSNGTVKVYTCKTYYNVYGGVYRVNALFFKSASQAGGNYYLTSMRDDTPVPDQARNKDGNNDHRVDSLTTNASAYQRDAFLVNIGDSWSSGQRVTNRIADCPKN